MDLFEALLARDWTAVGGWSLFLTVVIIIVVGSFKEWWVPGPRARRTEEHLEKSLQLNIEQADQIDKLLTANEITKHFFEETTPKRGARTNVVPNEGGAP